MKDPFLIKVRLLQIIVCKMFSFPTHCNCLMISLSALGAYFQLYLFSTKFRRGGCHEHQWSFIFIPHGYEFSEHIRGSTCVWRQDMILFRIHYSCFCRYFARNFRYSCGNTKMECIAPTSIFFARLWLKCRFLHCFHLFTLRSVTTASD